MKHCQVGKQTSLVSANTKIFLKMLAKYVERIAEVTGVPLGIVSVRS